MWNGLILFIELIFFTIKFKILAHFWQSQLFVLWILIIFIGGWIIILQLQVDKLRGPPIFKNQHPSSAATSVSIDPESSLVSATQDLNSDQSCSFTFYLSEASKAGRIFMLLTEGRVGPE